MGKESEAFYVVDIKSNPIHNFFSRLAHTKIFLCCCAPSQPMSLSTEVDFFAVERKIGKKKLRKLTHQYIVGGSFSCEGDSAHIEESTHTTLCHPHKQPLCTFRRFSISLSRKISFTLSMQNVTTVWVDFKEVVVYENAFHLFRIAEQGKISE